MREKIISLTNQKGGPGKSTVTMNLAGALAMDGFKILVVNADKQATAVKWSSHAPDDEPFPAVCVNLYHAGAKIHREIEKIYKDFDFTLIDCPPNLESVVPASAVVVSDLVLMVTRPTMTDFDSLTDFLPLVQRAQASRESLIAKVLINQFKRCAMSELTLRTIKDNAIEMMTTTIGDRTAFTEADPLGSHVLAMKGVAPAAKREIKELREEILELLEIENE